MSYEIATTSCLILVAIEYHGMDNYAAYSIKKVRRIDSAQEAAISVHNSGNIDNDEYGFKLLEITIPGKTMNSNDPHITYPKLVVKEKKIPKLSFV